MDSSTDAPVTLPEEQLMSGLAPPLPAKKDPTDIHATHAHVFYRGCTMTLEDVLQALRNRLNKIQYYAICRYIEPIHIVAPQQWVVECYIKFSSRIHHNIEKFRLRPQDPLPEFKQAGGFEGASLVVDDINAYAYHVTNIKSINDLKPAPAKKTATPTSPPASDEESKKRKSLAVVSPASASKKSKTDMTEMAINSVGIMHMIGMEGERVMDRLDGNQNTTGFVQARLSRIQELVQILVDRLDDHC